MTIQLCGIPGCATLQLAQARGGVRAAGVLAVAIADAHLGGR